MTLPAARDQGALLEECLQNEERRLREMQQEGASWLRRYKQRRRIARGQRALDWADARKVGENPFMWGIGLKTGFAGFISTVVIFSVGRFASPMTLDRMIDAAILGVAVGSVGGFFRALTEWERRERELEETLAELLPKPQP